ncbi:hypothetical protein H0H87_000840 [Tephrocybe sp. NHM501043]|nr:hypothetical protein H0H87_000840 [Tephrocybe sp. NHM501043]
MLTVGRRDTRVEVFHPETTFETFGTGLEQPAAFGELDLPDAAIDFVTSHLGVDESQVTYKSGLQAETTKAAYVNQVHNGISFVNAVANVAWKDNKVVSFGSSFVNNALKCDVADNVAPSEPSISLEAVIPAAEELLDGKYNGHPATLEYLVQSDGFVALVHVLQIQNEVSGTWYEAFVDAHSGEILSVTDFVSDALVCMRHSFSTFGHSHSFQYVALPITKQTLPEGLELLLDPQDIYSSPSGWHDDGKNKTNSTSGNNVVAYKGTQPNVTFQSGPNLAFNYTYSDKIAPTSGQNIDAARTNAFYIVNTVHDFAYRYGFTEAAFNFQNDNFDRGGVGHDRVLMSVQDSSGYNNANFGTPAESVLFRFYFILGLILMRRLSGQSGICRMYVWTYTRVGCSAVQQDTLIYEHPQVRRDGSLENDIVVHELTHGITNRMTGGGTARCLQTIEARGMGEGWSDAMAEYIIYRSLRVSY